MFALNRLKEQTLRRLYKFILKRVIGQYLDSELLLEQLTVESRTGLVSLKDLRFDCKLLNELLQGMPFQIVSAEVAELQATISYDTLLADGCNLTAKGCRIVFAPVEPPPARRGHQKHPASSSSSKSSSTKSPSSVETDQPPVPPQRESSGSGGDEDPLLFIAQWIEVVIARLKCTVEDLEVILVSHPQLARKFSGKDDSERHVHTGPAAASVHFVFDTISFYNTHPKMLQQDCNASTIASTSHMLSSYGGSGAGESFVEADISLLSFRKLLSVKSIRVDVKTHSHMPSGTSEPEKFASTSSLLPLLHFTEGGQIEMMIQPPPQKRRSTFVNSASTAGGGPHPETRQGAMGTGGGAGVGLGHSQSLAYNKAALDMEISFPKLVFNLQASQAPVLLAVANSFVDGKVEQAKAFGEPTKAAGGIAGPGTHMPLPLHNLGAEMQHLQEGLHNLHQKHTLHHLEELGAAFSGGVGEGGVSDMDRDLSSEHFEGDEVDFARLTHLLKKYQLTRELLTAEDRARRAASYTKEASKDSPQSHASFLGSPVESDSEVEFPSTQLVPEEKGYDFDSEDDVKSGSDDDDFDSALFFDAAEGSSTTSKSRRGVRVVQRGTAASRDLSSSMMSQSHFGSQSMADSSMFHTTANVSFNLPSGSTRNARSGVRQSDVGSGGAGGGATVSGGTFFRLFVDSTEVIYQDDRQMVQSASQRSEDSREKQRLLEKLRAEGDKLVLQLSATVMSFSAPAPPPSSYSSIAPGTTTTTVPKFSASISGIVLHERVCVETTTLPSDSGLDSPSLATGTDTPQYQYKYQNNVLVRLSADKVPDMSSLVIPPEPDTAQQHGSTDAPSNRPSLSSASPSVFADDDMESPDEDEDWAMSSHGGGGSFSGPQLEVRGSLSPLDPKTGKGGTAIHVQFHHATSSLCVATILKWIKRLEGVVEMQQEAASGLFKLECTVSMKSLEVLLLCDPGESPPPTPDGQVDHILSSSEVRPMTEETLPSVWGSDSDESILPPPPPPANPRKPRFRTDWTKVSTGLGLGAADSSNARWKRVHSDSIYDVSRSAAESGRANVRATSSNDMPTSTPPGCLRIVVVSVTVKVLSTNVPCITSNFSLQVSSINAFLRLSSPYLPIATPSTTFSSAGAATLKGYLHTYELGFLSMRSLGDQRISVTKCSFPTADFDSYGQQSKKGTSTGAPMNLNGNTMIDLSKSSVFTGTTTQDGLSPSRTPSDGGAQKHSSTLKEVDEIIDINTQIVRADLRSLELNAFIGVITGIVPTPPSQETCSASSGFGAKKGQNSCKANTGGSTGGAAKLKPPSFLALRVFSHILSVRFAPDCIKSSSVRVPDTKKDIFAYCFSIREPHFELVSSTVYPDGSVTPTPVFSSSSSSNTTSYQVKDLYTIAASDLSFFEIPLSQLETTPTCWGDKEDDSESLSHTGGRGESCRGARFRESKGGGGHGREYHFIPLLHRTSLESAMMGKGGGGLSGGKDEGTHQMGEGMLGGQGRPKHRALKFTVCMMEDVTLTTAYTPIALSTSVSSSSFAKPVVSSSSLRNTSFDLCLSDMTYRFDPHSMWFQHFPEIFDPIGSTDIVPCKPCGTDSQDGSGGAAKSGDGVGGVGGASAATVNIFGRTRLSLSVNKLLIDCCQPDNTEEQLLKRLSQTHKIPSQPRHAEGTGSSGSGRKRRHSHSHIPSIESRILLSVGKVSVSSTLVTNSNRVALSATLSDASVRVSNKLIRRSSVGKHGLPKVGNAAGPVGSCIEQSPVDILGYYIEETYGSSKPSSRSARPTLDDLTIDFDTYVDVHGFVLMGALDRFQIQIHLNTPSAALAAARLRLEREKVTMANFDDMGERFGASDYKDKNNEKQLESNVVPIGVECSAGTASVYGCADSLLVLVNAITHIVDSVNASKDDRLKASEGSMVTSESDPNMTHSQLLPLPSQTALMLSPVSAIRHSFVAAEQQEKKEKLLQLQSLNDRAEPSSAASVTSSKLDSDNGMQKSVSFFFESPLDQESDVDLSQSGGDNVLNPPEMLKSSVSAGTALEGGRGGVLVPKLPPKADAVQRDDANEETDFAENVWGDEIEDCFSQADVTSSVDNITSSSVESIDILPTSIKLDTDQTSTDGILKDTNWIDSLQDDMFAPTTGAPSAVSSGGGMNDGSDVQEHPNKRVVFNSRHGGKSTGDEPPRTTTEVEKALQSVSEMSNDTRSVEKEGPVLGGLNAAMIEEYYPEPEAEVESEEEPEYAARFYAQYDYDEIDDNDDNFEGGVFAYEEDEDEDEEHGFEEIDDVDDVGDVSELEKKRQEVEDIESDEDSVVSSNSSGSSVSASSSSGYSEDSFVSESSDGSVAARRKAKQKSGDGSMWKSWGVMKSVSDLRQQQEKDMEDEMRELVNMSTSAMYKTGVMSVSEALSMNPSAISTEVMTGGSTLLTVDVDTDSEGSVVSEVEGDVNLLEVEEEMKPGPVGTTDVPFVQVHSEGQVDEDHQRAWESMSFYQQVQDGDISTSQILSPSVVGKDIESLKVNANQSQKIGRKDSNGGKGGVAEQKAQWYDMSAIKTTQIHPLHMTEPPRDRDTLDDYTRDEGPDGGQCLITPKINISVKFSIRVKLFAGQEWADDGGGEEEKDSSAQSRHPTHSPPPAKPVQTKTHSTRSGSVRRGKYDNSDTIEKHLGELASTSGAGLFAKTTNKGGMSTRALQQSRTAKNLSLKHQHAASNANRAVGLHSLGRKHISVSRDKANGVTEISFSSCRGVYRLYPHQQPTSSSSAFAPPPLPTERYGLRVHDMLVSFTQAGRKSKKVLGNWLNPSKPVESHLPLIEITAAGFDLDDHQSQTSFQEDSNSAARVRGGAHGLEYRMEVTVLPLRCYLDGSYVNFIRGFLDYLGQQQKRQVALEKATYARMQKQLGLVSTTHVEKDDGQNKDGHGGAISCDNEDDEVELNEVDVIESVLPAGSNLPNPSTVSAATSGKIQDALESSINTNINTNTSSKAKSKENTYPKPAVNSDLPNVDLPTPPPLTYFQSWKVNPLELKINYAPNPLDLRALQKGDFMQLLNLLSIDSLELSLTKVWLVGVSGAAAGFSKMGEEWVKEIYAHQMHRLLSSTGPLRGISSIGTSIHGLLLVPVQEYRVNGAVGVLKALKRESVSLLKTVTRETLTAGSKVSHFLANTLIDLVTPEGAVPSNRRHREAGGGRGHRNEKQPTGFTDSLDRAYEAVSREVTSTLDTIVVLPFKEYRRTGHAGGALKCVVRAIPVAVLRPTAGAAEALSYTLLGLRNNLDPDQRRDEEDVWNVDVKE